MGSSVMRSQQLAHHMQLHFGAEYDVERVFTSRNIRKIQQKWLGFRYPGAAYVFSKYAAASWKDEDYLNLKKNASAILIDYVDSPVRSLVRQGVDVHISTSLTGARMMRDFIAASKDSPFDGTVDVVLHNYDAAIRENCVDRDLSGLSLAYLGSRDMTTTTELADGMVTFLDAGSPQAFLRSIEGLGRFNAHYCVRRSVKEDPGRVPKPFTKGVTAAACGAVILTDRGTDDAVDLLGDDYPFLIASNSAAHIDEGLRHMNEAFGERNWDIAVERMRGLHEKTSHRAIARQLHHAIKSVAD